MFAVVYVMERNNSDDEEEGPPKRGGPVNKRMCCGIATENSEHDANFECTERE